MADTPTPDPAPEPVADPEQDPPQPDPDAGAKSALNSERAYRREAEKRSKALEAELATLRAASLTETERAIAEARREGETEAETRWKQRTLDELVLAVADGRSVDPELVSRLVDRDALGDDINRTSVAAAVDKILKERPYLAIQADGSATAPRVPSGVRETAKPTATPEQEFANFLTNQLKQQQG